MIEIKKEILDKYQMDNIDHYINGFGEKEGTLVFCQAFLKLTDHIPNKITEKLIEDLADATLFNILDVFFAFITAVKVEYKEILQYRKQAREIINEIEAAEEQPA